MMSTGRNHGSSLLEEVVLASPAGCEPCHSRRNWLTRLVTTSPMKTVSRYAGGKWSAA